MKMQPKQLTVSGVMNRYSEVDTRRIHRLRVLETDWPIVLELVPRVMTHYFADAGDPDCGGYLALSHALDKYDMRGEISDTERLWLFLSNFMYGVCAQAISRAADPDPSHFEQHIKKIAAAKKFEFDTGLAGFAEAFLSGKTSIARVWKRVSARVSEVENV